MGDLNRGETSDSLWSSDGFMVKKVAEGHHTLVEFSSLNPDVRFARLWGPGDLTRLSWWFARQAIRLTWNRLLSEF